VDVNVCKKETDPMTNSKFKGKVVWITGASSGIGEALATRFARTGSRLILSARRERELTRVAACSGAEAVTVLPLDLSKPESIAGAARQALAVEGHIDVMVHNGGIGQRAFAADTDYSVDDLIMRTNYLGPVALTKALLPSMRARRQGHFIVVSSVLGKFGLPGRSGYCASKHALHGFFDTLRAELWKDGIQVTLVLPSWVRTNVSINALTGNGAPHGKMDSGTARGFPPEFCAEKIIAGAESGKAEVDVVKFPEKAALYLNRLSPTMFRRVLRGRPL
jgi:dehydrogenase/reductase SDR family protein 7B